MRQNIFRDTFILAGAATTQACNEFMAILKFQKEHLREMNERRIFYR